MASKSLGVKGLKKTQAVERVIQRALAQALPPRQATNGSSRRVYKR